MSEPDEQLFATRTRDDRQFMLGVINPAIEEHDGMTICAISLNPSGVLVLIQECIDHLKRIA